MLAPRTEPTPFRGEAGTARGPHSRPRDTASPLLSGLDLLRNARVGSIQSRRMPSSVDDRSLQLSAAARRWRCRTRPLLAVAWTVALLLAAPALARAARPTAAPRPSAIEASLAQERKTQGWRVSRASPRSSPEIRASRPDDSAPPPSVRQARADGLVEQQPGRPRPPRHLVDYGAQHGPQPPAGISSRQPTPVRFRLPTQFLVFGSGSFLQWGHRTSGAPGRLFALLGSGDSTPSLRAPPMAA
jgi:hypothetical protein